MIWVHRIRSGEEIAINPSDIVKIEMVECYGNPRKDAPNTFHHPEDLDPNRLHGNGSTITMRGKGVSDEMVEEIPEDLKVLLRRHRRKVT